MRSSLVTRLPVKLAPAPNLLVSDKSGQSFSFARRIIYCDQRCDMDRNALAARILKTDGILLLVVAVIHLIATPPGPALCF